MMHFLFFLLLFQQDNPKDLQAVFDTGAGSFILEFYADHAPNHVRQFIQLARDGFYNGTTFHGMVAHGIVQGGDPLTKDPSKKNEYGTGGFKRGLKAELSNVPFAQGTVAATLLPDDTDSAGSQFLICVTDQLQFTGQFTAFARVVEGIEVVDSISMTPVDAERFASERIVINSVTVRRIPPPPPPPFSEESIDELKKHRIVMETAKGNIVLELFPDKAPNHVRHFLRLASLGVFDKTAFHRVAPGFVIQAGDLNTRSEPVPQAAQKYVVRIRAEINDVKHAKGILSMARGDEIDSALTSFFIVLGDQAALDGVYTVFGRVAEGLDVVDQVAAVPAEGERPTQRIDIHRMRVDRRN